MSQYVCYGQCRLESSARGVGHDEMYFHLPFLGQGAIVSYVILAISGLLGVLLLGFVASGFQKFDLNEFACFGVRRESIPLEGCGF